MGNVENSSNLATVVVINGILNVPLMFTSIIGNALVLVAILRTPSLRSVPSTIFLCSLAITDFLVGLVVQPVYIANKLHHSTGGPLAKVEDFMTFFLCGVSLATITAISLDRYLALHYHVTYANLMTTKCAMNASASLWFVSILLPCLKVWKSEVVFLIAGVYITICLVISSASYIKIYFIVRHNQIQIHAQQQAVNSFNISVNIPDSNNFKETCLKDFYILHLHDTLLLTLSILFIATNHLSYRLTGIGPL